MLATKMLNSSGHTWTHDEVRCHFNIWAEGNVSQLLQKVYKNIQNITQCYVKVKKLHQQYIKVLYYESVCLNGFDWIFFLSYLNVIFLILLQTA